MGIRNPKRETLGRLESKTLDARFLTIVEKGLSCSPFEAKAVLEVVQEVYAPYLNEAQGEPQPGVVTVVAVSAEEPAGKPVRQCEKFTVRLHLHRGADDDRLLQEKGPDGFRQSRIPDLCQEALSQGALLTREDLAHHIFYVGERTISRDLARVRQDNPALPIPLRSTVQDIGPVLTHRVEIVKMALEGKTTSQIRDILHHSPGSIANYLSTFTRCAQLARQGMQEGQIAFLLRRGKGLVRSYLELLKTCEEDKNRAYHLGELLRIGEAAGEKIGEGGNPMGGKIDPVRKRYGPLLDKSLIHILAHTIRKHFPSLAGEVILRKFAEMILQTLDQHLKSRDRLCHGQMIWHAVSVDDPPARGKTIANTDLVPVVLDVSIPQDIENRLLRKSLAQRTQEKAIRLCQQAFEQNALLSNCDLAELLNTNDPAISQALTEYEERTQQIVPRRATIHDVGNGLTHKRIICWKRYVEGKEADQVARETYHSLEAVDRYLAQYDRVRHCRKEGMTPQKIAYILNCSLGLVHEYFAIDDEIGGKNA